MKRFKTINETFTEEEYQLLTDVKGEQTWREFILSFVKSKKEV